jgi:hypothetical protein
MTQPGVVPSGGLAAVATETVTVFGIAAKQPYRQVYISNYSTVYHGEESQKLILRKIQKEK